MDESEIHLHDPAGFPHVSLPLEQLELAWKAERIGYRRGYYRYWTSPKRAQHPTEGEIYDQALQYFRSGYRHMQELAPRMSWAIGREAILACAVHIRGGEVTPPQTEHLTGFALRLGAKRALDFAAFFSFRDTQLAVLKVKQAELLGKCHTLAVRKNWTALADTLQELADVEEEFRTLLLAR